MQVITEENHQDKVELLTHEEFLVILAETPSSGYRWEIRTNPKELKLMVDDYLTEPVVNKERVGGTVYRYWRFKATGPLNNSLQLIRTRSWEGDQPEDKRIEIHLHS